MIEIFVYYLIALLLCCGAFYLAFFYLNHKKKRKTASFLIGVISFVLYFLILTLLFRFTFKTLAYYNTLFFRMLVGTLYISLLALFRFWLVKIVYFNRSAEDSAASFFAGFGAAPATGMGFYLLLMTVMIIANSLFNGPAIVDQTGVLSFRDNTVISVFLPIPGHVSFAVSFLFFFGMIYAAGILEKRILTEKHPLWAVVIWVILSCAAEGFCVACIPFMKLLALLHWHLPLIFGVCAGIQFLLARFIPGKTEKPSNYVKQFE